MTNAVPICDMGTYSTILYDQNWTEDDPKDEMRVVIYHTDNIDHIKLRWLSKIIPLY